MKILFPLSQKSSWKNSELLEKILHNKYYLFLFWAIPRIIILAFWLYYKDIQDVRYYYNRLSLLNELGHGLTLPEYPTPVIWVLAIPYYLGFTTIQGYVFIFMLSMIAFDVSFSYLLWKVKGEFSAQAIIYWTVFLTFIGSTIYLRIDILTAWLVGVAILALANRDNKLAGSLVSIGAAIKLWPAALIPSLLINKKRRENIKIFIFSLSIGGAIALISLVAGGWDRLLSPLVWQSRRKLQIESISATPAMIARAFSPFKYDIRDSTFQAFEIQGPGTDILLHLAKLSTYVGFLIIIIFYIFWFLSKNRRLFTSAVMMMFIICIMIITNKTFSPQYIIWLGPPMAATIATIGIDRNRISVKTSERRSLTGICLLILFLTILTQLIYPTGYAGLVHPQWNTFIVTFILVIRNTGMVILTFWLGIITWKSMKTSK